MVKLHRGTAVRMPALLLALAFAATLGSVLPASAADSYIRGNETCWTEYYYYNGRYYQYERCVPTPGLSLGGLSALIPGSALQIVSVSTDGVQVQTTRGSIPSQLLSLVTLGASRNASLCGLNLTARMDSVANASSGLVTMTLRGNNTPALLDNALAMESSGLCSS